MLKLMSYPQIYSYDISGRSQWWEMESEMTPTWGNHDLNIKMHKR